MQLSQVIFNLRFS